ncbi:MAG: glycosyltransferase, partial [Bacteroidales bacterium]|nr:glycosyltransferase [Bacteroidales bacterium]
PTKYADRLRHRAEQLGLGHRFVMLHGVPSEHLPALYRSAIAFAYPSRYEGFGIPIIEALCADLPVVGATGSCLEEAGGDDQLYVHPDDTTTMAQHLLRLASSPEERTARAAKGKAYVQRFLGQQQAKRLRAIYEQVVSEHATASAQR